MALVVAGLWMLCGLLPTSGWAQMRLPCDQSFYLSLRNGGGSRIMRGEFTPQGPRMVETLADLPGRQVGPLGYSVWDGHLYALDVDGLSLLRIDAEGNVTFLADMSGRLDPSLTYTAGFMSPAGVRFTVMGHNASDGRDQQTHAINLVQGFGAGQNAIINVEPVEVTAAAYSPAFGVLYGFDEQRGSLVQIGSGLVSSYNYPSLSSVSMQALFFDENNDLWGYGSPSGGTAENFFRIDAGQGTLQDLGQGNASGLADGCSCPYRVRLRKELSARQLTACDSLVVSYEVESQAGFIYQNLHLRDTLPPGLRLRNVLEVPRSSDFALVNDSVIELSIRFLRLGRSVLRLSFDFEATFVGTWASEATLDSLPWGLGTAIRSEGAGEGTAFDLRPLSVRIEGGPVLCQGGRLALQAVAEPAGTQAAVRWSTGATTSTIEVDQPGDYMVTLTQGCDTVRDTVAVRLAADSLTLDLGPDRSTQQGVAVTLLADHNAATLRRMAWGSEHSLRFACDTCLSQTLRPLFDTRVWAEVEDGNGCQAHDTVRIAVDTVRSLKIPTVFTPNQDQLNDRFFLFSPNPGTLRSLHIYDRWGRAVFVREDWPLNQPAGGWDGTIGAKLAPPGVYFWVAKIEFPDGSRLVRKGQVTLLR